jgi:hypothetical protein
VVRPFGDNNSSSVPEKNYRNCRIENTDDLFKYNSLDIEKDNNISLSNYQGNVSLVVNLASF